MCVGRGEALRFRKLMPDPMSSLPPMDQDAALSYCSKHLLPHAPHHANNGLASDTESPPQLNPFSPKSWSLQSHYSVTETLRYTS